MFNTSLESIRSNIIQVLDSTFHDEYLLIFLVNRKIGPACPVPEQSEWYRVPIFPLQIDIAVHRLSPIDKLVIEKIKDEIKEKLDYKCEVGIINMTDRSLDEDFLEIVLKNGLLWRKPINYGKFLKDLKDRAISTSVEKLLKGLNTK